MHKIIKGKEYSFSKVDAFAQLHVVRRLLPVIGDLMKVLGSSEVLKSGKKFENMSIEDVNFDAIAEDIAPLFKTLSKLPDEDVDYCIKALLKKTQIKMEGGGFANIMTGEQFMYDFIRDDLHLLLSLFTASFKHNLQGFLSALPSELKEGLLSPKELG